MSIVQSRYRVVRWVGTGIVVLVLFAVVMFSLGVVHDNAPKVGEMFGPILRLVSIPDEAWPFIGSALVLAVIFGALRSGEVGTMRLPWTPGVVLAELPFAEHRRNNSHKVCRAHAEQLAAEGEDAFVTASGGGGFCVLCGKRIDRDDAGFSTMRTHTPKYDWVWVGSGNGGHLGIRPVGTVTEMSWMVRRAVGHEGHPHCGYCVSCVHDAFDPKNDEICATVLAGNQSNRCARESAA